MLADFEDRESGAFFNTAKDGEQLILRPREGSDGAIPSANALAARALAKLAYPPSIATTTANARRARCVPMASCWSAHRVRSRPPWAWSISCCNPPVEIVLAGVPGEAGYEALRKSSGRTVPARTQSSHTSILRDPSAEAEGLPLSRGIRAGSRQGRACTCVRTSLVRRRSSRSRSWIER